MKSHLLFSLILLAWLPGCADGKDPPYYPTKWDGQTAPDRGADVVGHFDLYPTLKDGAADQALSPDSGCQLGTVSHCASCGDVCPPGQDTSATHRVCLNKACDIQCKDEYYDVNGTASDGCEAGDDLPLHETWSKATSLGKLKDTDTSKSASALLPSDDRKHLLSPTDRLYGREDWFSVHLEDTALGSLKGLVKVRLNNLPASGSYEAQAEYVCDNGKKPGAKTATIQGGSETTLSPSTACNSTSIGDDSGTLYLRVVKKSASYHSAKSYTIEMIP